MRSATVGAMSQSPRLRWCRQRWWYAPVSLRRALLWPLLVLRAVSRRFAGAAAALMEGIRPAGLLVLVVVVALHTHLAAGDAEPVREACSCPCPQREREAAVSRPKGYRAVAAGDGAASPWKVVDQGRGRRLPLPRHHWERYRSCLRACCHSCPGPGPGPTRMDQSRDQASVGVLREGRPTAAVAGGDTVAAMILSLAQDRPRRTWQTAPQGVGCSRQPGDDNDDKNDEWNAVRLLCSALLVSA